MDMADQTVPDMDTGTCRHCNVNWPISFYVHCHIDMSDQTVPDMDIGTCRPTGTSPPSRPAQESRKLKQIKGPFLLTVPLKTVPLLIGLSVSMYIVI